MAVALAVTVAAVAVSPPFPLGGRGVQLICASTARTPCALGSKAPSPLLCSVPIWPQPHAGGRQPGLPELRVQVQGLMPRPLGRAASEALALWPLWTLLRNHLAE